MNRLVFLDTETFGLELDHDIWEMAWAVNDGPVLSAIVPHDARNADPKALEINGYLRRGLGRQTDPTFEYSLRAALKGATVVGATVSFDMARLQRRWGVTPWHYRLVDVSSMSLPILGPDADGLPMGLWDICNTLRDRWSLEVPLPSHRAADDVRATRAAFHGLLGLATTKGLGS